MCRKRNRLHRYELDHSRAGELPDHRHRWTRQRDSHVGAVVERALMRRVNRRDAGMTLIEVLVGVVILSMITGGIVTALLTALNVYDPTSHRVQETNDAQTIAAFLARDAQA